MPRRTISIPEYLDDHIASVARERGTSYSAAAVRLLEQAADLPLPYAGVGEGPGDLSIRTEEYLDQIAEELWDDHRHRSADRSA